MHAPCPPWPRSPPPRCSHSCILSRGGKAILMTVDDKPLDKAEKKRIERAGGSVKDNKVRLSSRVPVLPSPQFPHTLALTVLRPGPRVQVNGELGVSRAFGDFTFKDKTRKSAKKQLVVAEPHVQVGGGGCAALPDSRPFIMTLFPPPGAPSQRQGRVLHHGLGRHLGHDVQ